MSFIVKSVSGFAGVIAYLGLAAASVNAQQAKFTLPVEAHWGRTVLEPGDYEVKFPSALDPTPVLLVHGNGKGMYVLLQSKSAGEGTEPVGKVILRNIDGIYVVESVSNPITHDAYLFGRPKTHETTAARANVQQSARVAVELKKIGQ